jgi:hypothetical protein
MARLCGVFSIVPPRRYVARRQFRLVLDGIQQIEGVLRMGLDKPSFGNVSLGFMWLPFCTSVKAVGWSLPCRGCGHTARVRASIVINRQQRVDRCQLR